MARQLVTTAASATFVDNHELESARRQLRKNFPGVNASPDQILLVLAKASADIPPGVLRMAFVVRAIGKPAAAVIPMLDLLSGYILRPPNDNGSHQ